MTQQFILQAPPGGLLAKNITYTIKNYSETGFKIVKSQEKEYKMIFDISVTGQAGKGVTNDLLIINTEDPAQPKIEIPIQANHLDLYEVKPPIVTLNNEQSSKDVKWVEIIGYNGLVFQINRIVIDDPSLVAIESPSNNNDKTQFGICLKNSKPQKSKTGKIEVFVEGQIKPLIVHYLYICK
jgi:hypothetical protein